MPDLKTDDPIHLLGADAVRAANAATKPSAKPAKAEDDEKDKKAKADEDMEDDEEDKEKSKKAKKAKAKDGDDDEDDEKAKAAVVAERARCVAIFTAPEAAKNPALAAHLVETGASVDNAVKTLALSGGSAPAAAAPAAKPTLADRMASVDVPNPGIGDAEQPSQDSPKAVADKIIRTAMHYGVLPQNS